MVRGAVAPQYLRKNVSSAFRPQVHPRLQSNNGSMIDASRCCRRPGHQGPSSSTKAGKVPQHNFFSWEAGADALAQAERMETFSNLDVAAIEDGAAPVQRERRRSDHWRGEGVGRGGGPGHGHGRTNERTELIGSELRAGWSQNHFKKYVEMLCVSGQRYRSLRCCTVVLRSV